MPSSKDDNKFDSILPNLIDYTTHYFVLEYLVCLIPSLEADVSLSGSKSDRVDPSLNARIFGTLVARDPWDNHDHHHIHNHFKYFNRYNNISNVGSRPLISEGAQRSCWFAIPTRTALGFIIISSNTSGMT